MTRDRTISIVFQALLYMWAVWMILTGLIVVITVDIVAIVLYTIIGAAVAYPLFWGARRYWNKEEA